jgi:predicted methyltransferase
MRGGGHATRAAERAAWSDEMAKSATPRRGQRASRAAWLGCALALVALAPALGCGRGKVRTRASIAALAADPARDAWQKPAEVLAKAGIAAGQSVAELGAAEGYWLPHLAAAVGPAGRVWGLEFEEDLVAKLRGRVAASRLTNVTVALVREGELPGSEALDAVALLDSYGALAAPVGTLEALRGRLKVGGLLVVVGHKRDEAIAGPPLEERLDAETVVAEARGAGFAAPASQHDLGRQWMVVFRNEGGAAEAPPAP